MSEVESGQQATSIALEYLEMTLCSAPERLEARGVERIDNDKWGVSIKRTGFAGGDYFQVIIDSGSADVVEYNHSRHTSQSAPYRFSELL